MCVCMCVCVCVCVCVEGGRGGGLGPADGTLNISYRGVLAANRLGGTTSSAS
jgi:hypothetical protein